MQPGSHEARVAAPIATQIKWEEFPGHTTAFVSGYPVGWREHSLITASSPGRRDWRIRVEVQFRDVWLRALKPETPGAEIWGSQSWGKMACGGWDFWEVAPL